MYTSILLVILVHIFMLLIDQSSGKIQEKARCQYVPVSEWSACNASLLSTFRKVELVAGDVKSCEPIRTETKRCKRNHLGGTGRKQTKQNANNKNKNAKDRPKKRNKLGCRYKKGKWSGCGPENTKTLVQTLLPGSPLDCEQMIVLAQACIPNSDIFKTEQDQELSLMKQTRKVNRKRNKQKIKERNKQKSHIKKNNINFDSQEPAIPDAPEVLQMAMVPPPADLRIEPHATFAVVTWQPPVNEETRRLASVDSFQIGYGQGFPDLHTVTVNGETFVYRVQDLDPGREYIISVRARAGEVTSQPLYENIRTLPASEVGKQVDLSVVGVKASAVSSQAINVSWIPVAENSEVLAPGPKQYYVRFRQLNHLSHSVSPPAGFQTLDSSQTFVVVSDLLPFTKYEFAVMAALDDRNSSWSPSAWNITLETAPSSPPEDLTVIPNTAVLSQVTLSWQPPSAPNGVITGYQASYSLVSNQTQGPVETKDVTGNKLSLTLLNLAPGSSYDFTVRARNSQGLGPPASVHKYHLPGRTPVFRPQLQAPVKLHARVMSSSSVLLTWEDLVQTTGDEKSATSARPTYLVRYRPVGTRLSAFQLASSTSANLTLSDLQPSTWYEFMVRVTRGRQESRWSSPVKNTTLAATAAASWVGPARPENLQVTVMSSNSALVSWLDPDRTGRKDPGIDKPPTPNTYMLRYRNLRKETSEFKLASLTLTSIFMIDLEPATKYEFSVRTDNGGQHSEWSSPVINKTFESAPSSGPSHVTVTMDEDDPTAAIIQWQPPELPNGDITGYIIFYETPQERKSLAVPAGELSHLIPFLKPHTKYFFRVGARNSQGFSPLSNRVIYRTPRVLGNPPTDVTVSPMSDDLYSAIVSWQPPNPNQRRIKSYTVTQYTEDGKQRTVLRVPGFTLTAVVRKLLPSTVYHLRVQAHYHQGSGPHSALVKYSIPKELLSDQLLT